MGKGLGQLMDIRTSFRSWLRRSTGGAACRWIIGTGTEMMHLSSEGEAGRSIPSHDPKSTMNRKSCCKEVLAGKAGWQDST